MKNVIASVLVMLSVSCAATNNVQHEVKEISTEIVYKANVGESKLGLNKKNEVILQHERQAQDELLIQDAVNMRLNDEMGHYEGELTECLRYMADERLGGSGILPEMPELDNLRSQEDYTEEFGMVKDGTLTIVKKSFFLDRLKNARGYEKSLRAMTKVLKKQNAQCQMKLEVARNKAGLPGKKAIAEGYYTSKGNWVQTKRGEQSLSDAFENQGKN